MLRPVFAMAVLLAALPATANEKPVNDKTASVPERDRQICKKMNMTGSRLSVKSACKTKAEWEEEARTGKDQIRRIDDLSGTSSPST